jgi:hypothetical protein
VIRIDKEIEKMKETFRWNPYADQPHNIGSRKERFQHHFKYVGSYISLITSNLRKVIPILLRYRKYKKKMYIEPVKLKRPFAVSVSSAGKKNMEVLKCLQELGILQSMVRIPSWEKDELDEYKKFVDLLSDNGIEVTIALLQNRDDVLSPSRWRDFLEEVFRKFSDRCSHFEVGHAWNRTKWGVWEYKEYLELAHAAFSAAEDYKVKLIGPAVIDFEFHLYPPLLRILPLDVLSSLLYVDRVGPPENTQCGWDTSKKIALLKAVVDKCTQGEKKIWITEMNWPLQGTGKYSPASGEPNVSEDKQADYLVRYYILALASGFVERVYWWQLVAPGYGLIDSRGGEWRKRPSFYAMKAMASFLDDSIFQGCFAETDVKIFIFVKEKDVFAVGWTTGEALEYTFPGRLLKVLDRSGKDVLITGNKVQLDSSPKYIFLSGDAPFSAC